MRYRTILDDIIIDFNGDKNPAELTLLPLSEAARHGHDTLGGVTITATQLSAIKVIRRAFNDLFDVERERRGGIPQNNGG